MVRQLAMLLTVAPFIGATWCFSLPWFFVFMTGGLCAFALIAYSHDFPDMRDWMDSL